MPSPLTTRRQFINVGALSLGGISLPQLLQAESMSGSGRLGHKAVILIYLTGGPPHQDMVDMKPDAPVEVRGEFRPIATKVPGVQLSELMPRVASMMDKFAIIRSLVGSDGAHASFQCVTGRRRGGPQPQGGWPELGSTLSRLHGPVERSVPPAIDLSLKMEHLPYNLPGPGFLGETHAPFKPSGQGMQDMVLHEGISLDRFHDRKALLRKFDALKRDSDSADLGGHSQRALEILTSSRLVDALDVTKEDPRIRARYGKDDPEVLSYSSKGYQAHMSKFLAARRLVEAGARCVTVAFADFDWHGSNFKRGRKVIPMLDQGLAALVRDLHERGLDRDVSVIVWGEFGRTPKINERAGRDHWPQVNFAMLAGGGMRTGQVIGATDKHADHAIDRPVTYPEVFATLYRQLGIDVNTATVPDLNGRPRYLCQQREGIRELL